jgi:hypothetical protein
VYKEKEKQKKLYRKKGKSHDSSGGCERMGNDGIFLI